VVVTILAVLIGDSGLMKSNPRSALYEAEEGRPVKFSDVYGVDEAKEVGTHACTEAKSVEH
jgi:ATP-dependent metalloprotease